METHVWLTFDGTMRNRVTTTITQFNPKKDISPLVTSFASMKQQELMHLHALLLEVRVFLDQTDDSSPAFSRYDSQPVRPTHVHRRKAAQSKAIALLLNELDGYIDSLNSTDLTLKP